MGGSALCETLPFKAGRCCGGDDRPDKIGPKNYNLPEYVAKGVCNEVRFFTASRFGWKILNS